MMTQAVDTPHSGPAPKKSKTSLMPKVDFTKPAGEPAYYEPDSPAWDIFKNPIALFVGGIAAVLLELGEPRVREGVWGHSIFPDQLLTRMKRTGAVTHITVYGLRKLVDQTVGAVVRMHKRVQGTTPKGQDFKANDPVLLDWVQCTVGYGFMEAYSRFCRPLSADEKDRSYRDAKPVADLFMAYGAPKSVAEQQAQFEGMRPNIVAHQIIFDFLNIMRRVPALPLPMRPMQWMLVRASISILPDWTRAQLQLDGADYALKPWEAKLIGAMGRLFEHLPIPGTAPVDAARRLGLPGHYLFRKRPR